MRYPAHVLAFLACTGAAATACDTPGGRAASQLDASTGTTTSGSDTSVGPGSDTGTTNPRPDGSDGDPAVCERWLDDRAQSREGSWSGSAQTCNAGDIAEPGRANTLVQVNLYRWLAGLPPVEDDADKNASAQACALLMHANNDIQHVVPESWDCYDAVGAQAAGLSNLATTPAVASLDLYITDSGIPTLGHRRWVLSRTLGPIGIGSTSRYSCLQVIDGEGNAEPRWTAWPPPGTVPYEALEHGFGLSTDAAGWSIQSDRIDLRNAEVTITKDGVPLDITTRQLATGYGSTFGIAMDPDGWSTESGATYSVAVRGLLEDIDYDVHVVRCE